VIDCNESGYKNDCMQSGLHVFAFSVPRLTGVILGTASRWTKTAQRWKSLLSIIFAPIRMVSDTSLYRFRLLHVIQVPVIAVFTKYDQFRRNVEMDLEDEGGDVNQASRMVHEIFETEYMCGLGKAPKFVQLESKTLQIVSTFVYSFLFMEGCMSAKAAVITLSKQRWMH
jgi:hypothetical protein